jgi:TPR repeat protein
LATSLTSRKLSAAAGRKPYLWKSSRTSASSSIFTSPSEPIQPDFALYGAEDTLGSDAFGGTKTRLARSGGGTTMARPKHRRLIRASALCTGMLLASAGSLLAAQSPQQPSPTSASAPAAAQSTDEAYRKGQDFQKKQNYAEAMRWYRIAAEKGNALAQIRVGGLYADGHGVPQNYGEALRWFRLAAAQGNSVAQRNVGISYLQGRGVAQDYAQALSWLRKAADQGDVDAQRAVGFVYFNGLGTAPDRAQAVSWWRKAAANGDDQSKEALKQLGEQ